VDIDNGFYAEKAAVPFSGTAAFFGSIIPCNESA